MLTKGEIVNSGWLLVGGVSTHGCIHYNQGDKKQENYLEDGEKASYSSEKIIYSKGEQKGMLAKRASLYKKLRDLGPEIPCGFFVTIDKTEALESTIKEIKAEITTFNDGCKYVSLSFNVLVFKISGEDESIVARQLFEVANEQLERLKDAMVDCNITKIRSVLRNSRGIVDIIQKPELKKNISEAFEKATIQVKEIAKIGRDTNDDLDAMEKAIDTAPIEIARIHTLEILNDIPEDYSINLIGKRELEI